MSRFPLRLLVLLALAGLIVGVLYVPFSLDFSLTSVAKVYPLREWKATQDPNGTIITTLQDFRSGSIFTSQVFQFERGDLVNVRTALQDSMILVNVGDTVIRINNIVLDGRLTTLRGELAVAEATLKSALAGDKPELIAEANEKVRLAEEQLMIKEKLFTVQRQMLKDSVTSVVEYKIAENEFEVAKREVDVANRTLVAVKAGLKPEDVSVAKANIESLKLQIGFLERQLTMYAIKCPIKGDVAAATMPGEMLIVQDRDRYLLHIPVKVEDLHYLNDTARIDLVDIITGARYTAQKLQVLPKVEVIGGRQAVILVASLTPPVGTKLSTGLSMACNIYCGSINQREYIRRMLNFKWTSE